MVFSFDQWAMVASFHPESCIARQAGRSRSPETGLTSPAPPFDWLIRWLSHKASLTTQDVILSVSSCSRPGVIDYFNWRASSHTAPKVRNSESRGCQKRSSSPSPQTREPSCLYTGLYISTCDRRGPQRELSDVICHCVAERTAAGSAKSFTSQVFQSSSRKQSPSLSSPHL